MNNGPEAAGRMAIRGTGRRTLWPGLQEQGEEERGALRTDMRILNCTLRLLCLLRGQGP